MKLRNVFLTIWLLLATAIVIAQELPLRVFNQKPLFGELLIEAAPSAKLNGEPVQLSPGLRIYSMQNMMVLYPMIQGKLVRVAYALDTTGKIQDVWILSPSEIEHYKKSFPSKGWTINFNL